MGKRPKQTFLQRRHIDGPQTHEKMFNVTNYQRNTNQNCNEVSTHTSQNTAAIKKSTNNKCWRECGEKGPLLQRWWAWILVQSLWRTVWKFLKKLKTELTYDLAIPLLSIYQKRIWSQRIHTPQYSLSTTYNSQDNEAI